MPEKLEPTVFIVEDDKAFCSALEWLFRSVSLNSEIFHNGLECLQNYSLDWYGCFVMDLRMPQMGGLELQEQLNKLHNKLPIIFITGHGDVPLAVRAMKAGAFDFITKPFNNQLEEKNIELKAALEKIQRAIEKTTQKIQNKNDQAFIKGYSKLTPRELEVLDCVVDGQLSKQIAANLNISLSTVELHRSNLMQKLGAKSVVDLVKGYLLNRCQMLN